MIQLITAEHLTNLKSPVVKKECLNVSQIGVLSVLSLNYICIYFPTYDVSEVEEHSSLSTYLNYENEKDKYKHVVVEESFRKKLGGFQLAKWSPLCKSLWHGCFLAVSTIEGHLVIYDTEKSPFIGCWRLLQDLTDDNEPGHINHFEWILTESDRLLLLVSVSSSSIENGDKGKTKSQIRIFECNPSSGKFQLIGNIADLKLQLFRIFFSNLLKNPSVISIIGTTIETTKDSHSNFFLLHAEVDLSTSKNEKITIKTKRKIPLFGVTTYLSLLDESLRIIAVQGREILAINLEDDSMFVAHLPKYHSIIDAEILHEIDSFVVKLYTQDGDIYNISSSAIDSQAHKQSSFAVDAASNSHVEEWLDENFADKNDHYYQVFGCKKYSCIASIGSFSTFKYQVWSKLTVQGYQELYLLILADDSIYPSLKNQICLPYIFKLLRSYSLFSSLISKENCLNDSTLFILSCFFDRKNNAEGDERTCIQKKRNKLYHSIRKDAGYSSIASPIGTCPICKEKGKNKETIADDDHNSPFQWKCNNGHIFDRCLLSELPIIEPFCLECTGCRGKYQQSLYEKVKNCAYCKFPVFKNKFCN